MAGIKEKATWSDAPFIAYLDAVDIALEAKCGRTSTQKELEAIAHMQEADCDPLDAVLSLAESARERKMLLKLHGKWKSEDLPPERPR